ncbi:LOW QUALITY PROTEIN: tektin-1 [Aplochiton taeniatus]
MSRIVGPAPKFLPPEWRLSNQVHLANTEVERTRSERLTAETQRLIADGEKVSKRMQQDVNNKLELRIHDIQFWRKELDKKLEEIVQEVEALITFKGRVERALEGFSEPLRVTLQCLEERQKRVSIDHVHDEVEQELMKEREVIEGVASLLQRTLEQIVEQIRLNRSSKYHLEKDLHDKFLAERIDDYCAVLSNASSTIPSTAPMDTQPAQVTLRMWERFCDLNLGKAERERNNSLSLRALVESLLEQTASGQPAQHRGLLLCLRLQVQETRAAKEKLEEHLAKVLSEVSSQERNMVAVEVAIQEKAGPLQLAQARLLARSQSPMEQCHDPAQSLQAEVRELSAQRRQEVRAQSEMQLKALARSQQSLEEEIQVKSNSLYIDQVICTQLRQPIAIHFY